MAQLIQMRQQIRAIESIEKITHAMRLISMSSHSQLNNKVPFIQNYKNELLKILTIVQEITKNEQNKILNPSAQLQRTLIVLIGSQKGLVGNFNSSITRLFENELMNNSYLNIDYIAVGKKIGDYLKKKEKTAYKIFNHISINNLSNLTTELFNIITNADPLYSNVIFFSNYPKSFFFQIPQKNVLIPTSQPSTYSQSKLETKIDIETYIWEQPINEILDYLTKDYIRFSIESLLFNSLLSEHAARFQFMNNATKNAEDLLNLLKLQYNKLRQAKITKEITELSVNL